MQHEFTLFQQGRGSTCSCPFSKVKNKQLRPLSSINWEPCFSNISAACCVLMYKFMLAFCLRKRKLLSNFGWVCIPLILFFGCLPGKLDKPLAGVGKDTAVLWGIAAICCHWGALPQGIYRTLTSGRASLPLPFPLPFSSPSLLRNNTRISSDFWFSNSRK